jgi:hypothetical protein
MQVFMSEGVIPNGLMPIIQEAMKAGEAPDPEVIAPMMEDPAKLQEILDLADSVAMYCFIEPKLHPLPYDPEDLDEQGAPKFIPPGDDRRNDNLLYIDEVDLNDKLFIFQFAVGGTARLEQFRQE